MEFPEALFCREFVKKATKKIYIYIDNFVKFEKWKLIVAWQSMYIYGFGNILVSDINQPVNQ